MMKTCPKCNAKHGTRKKLCDCNHGFTKHPWSLSGSKIKSYAACGRGARAAMQKVVEDLYE